MPDLRPLAEVTLETVQAAVRDALQRGRDADCLDEFVASIDWSGTDRLRPPIADLVGQLEGWTTDYLEGSLPEREYLDLLLGIMPEAERSDLLPLARPS